MANSAVLSIDIGNGHTNLVEADATTFKTLRIEEYPSLVRRATKDHVFPAGVVPFKTSFGNFLVGEQCLGERNEERAVDSSFYRSETAKVLFLKALLSCEDKHPVLVTGLPTGRWKEQRHEFKKKLSDWANSEGYQPRRIIVLPQHAGPFYDTEVQDEQGAPIPAEMLSGEVMIIDIGRGTLDCGLFYRGAPKDKTFGKPTGVHSIYTDTITQLKNKSHQVFTRKKRDLTDFPKDYTVREDMDEAMLDQWVRQGHYDFAGKRYNVRPLIDLQCIDYCEKKLAECLHIASAKHMSAVIVAGGGASVIGRELLEKYIGCRVYIPRESNFSIARGFLNYARIAMSSVHANKSAS